jgi:hypothetical protein
MSNKLNEISGSISGQELAGKVLVVRAKVLRAEFADKDRRFKAEGGFGCRPFLSGTAVVGRFLLDGEETRLNRGDFEGFAVHTDEESQPKEPTFSEIAGENAPTRPAPYQAEHGLEENEPMP